MHFRNSVYCLTDVVVSVCGLLSVSLQYVCTQLDECTVSQPRRRLETSSSVSVMVHRHPVQALSPLPPTTIITLTAWNLLCHRHIASCRLLLHSPLPNSVTAKMVDNAFVRCITLIHIIKPTMGVKLGR